MMKQLQQLRFILTLVVIKLALDPTVAFHQTITKQLLKNPLLITIQQLLLLDIGSIVVFCILWWEVRTYIDDDQVDHNIDYYNYITGENLYCYDYDCADDQCYYKINDSMFIFRSNIRHNNINWIGSRDRSGAMFPITAGLIFCIFIIHHIVTLLHYSINLTLFYKQFETIENQMEIVSNNSDILSFSNTNNKPKYSKNTWLAIKYLVVAGPIFFHALITTCILPSLQDSSLWRIILLVYTFGMTGWYCFYFFIFKYHTLRHLYRWYQIDSFYDQSQGTQNSYIKYTDEFGQTMSYFGFKHNHSDTILQITTIEEPKWHEYVMLKENPPYSHQLILYVIQHLVIVKATQLRQSCIDYMTSLDAHSSYYINSFWDYTILNPLFELVIKLRIISIVIHPVLWLIKATNNIIVAALIVAANTLHDVYTPKNLTVPINAVSRRTYVNVLSKMTNIHNIGLFIFFLSLGTFVLTLLLYFTNIDFQDLSIIQIRDYLWEFRLCFPPEWIDIYGADAQEIAIWFQCELYCFICLIDFPLVLDGFGQFVFITVMSNFFYETCFFPDEIHNDATSVFRKKMKFFSAYFLSYIKVFVLCDYATFSDHPIMIPAAHFWTLQCTLCLSSTSLLFYCQSLQTIETSIGKPILRKDSVLSSWIKFILYNIFKLDTHNRKMIKYLLIQHRYNNNKYQTRGVIDEENICDIIVSYCFINYQNTNSWVAKSHLYNEMVIIDTGGKFIYRGEAVAQPSKFWPCSITVIGQLVPQSLTSIVQAIKFDIFNYDLHDKNSRSADTDTVNGECAIVRFRLSIINEDIIYLVQQKIDYLNNQAQQLHEEVTQNCLRCHFRLRY